MPPDRVIAADDPVSLRLLRGEADEMAALQRVLASSSDYAQRVTGVPPGAADAQSLFSVLPDGKSYDDKFVFGIVVGTGGPDGMIGCIDCIRGFPDATTAHIGLLLLREDDQRRGLGTAAYRLLECEVLAWGTCRAIRLYVVRTNASVVSFWERLGFTATGEVRPYRYGSVVSESIVMAKTLDPTAA